MVNMKDKRFTPTLSLDDVRSILTKAGFSYLNTRPSGEERWENTRYNESVGFSNLASGDDAIAEIRTTAAYRWIAEAHWRYVICLEIDLISAKMFTTPEGETVPEFIEEYNGVSQVAARLIRGVLDDSIIDELLSGGKPLDKTVKRITNGIFDG
jgi:hypothetical protein